MDLMRVLKIFITSILFLLFIQGHASAYAEEPDNSERLFQYDFQTDYYARYVWRGIAYSKGPVIQPSLGLTVKELYVWVWANYDLSYGSDDSDFYRLNELDFNFTYTIECGAWTIEPGIFSYVYPNQDESPATAEASVSVSYGLGWGSLFIRQTVDIIEYGGAYFGEGGLSYQKDLGKISFEAETSLGWGSDRFNETYLDISKNALNLYSWNLSWTYYITENFYVCPHLEFSVILDHDLRDAVDDFAILNGGLLLGLEF